MKNKWIKSTVASTALLLIGGSFIPSEIGGASKAFADRDYDNYYNQNHTNYKPYKNKMVVNGRYDDDVYNYSNSWYLPADDLAKSLGGYFYYNRYTGTGTFNWNGNTISLTNQSSTVLSNGKNINLSANALLLDDGWLDQSYKADDLYVPIDFVEKVLNGTVTTQTQGLSTLVIVSVNPTNTGNTNTGNTNNGNTNNGNTNNGNTNNGNTNNGNTNTTTTTINGVNIYNALVGQNGWRKLSATKGEYQPYRVRDEIISYKMKRKYSTSYLEIDVDNVRNYTNYYGKTSLTNLLNAAVDPALANQLLDIADTALKTGTHAQIGKKISSANYDAYVYTKQSRKGTEVKIYIGAQGFSLYR